MNSEPAHETRLNQARPPASLLRRLRRIGHHVLRALTIGFVIFIALAAISFLRFTETIAELSAPDDTQSVEAIVALTGGSQRIDQALNLLEGGVGKRLLISGVNPATSSAELLRVTGADDRIFKCCVDIGYGALDTIGNANETALWIQENGYRQVLVVTNNYHMPRSLLELSEASPGVSFLAFPVARADLRTQEWMSDPLALRTLVTEYVKYSLARLRYWSGARPASGLRADIRPTAPRATAASILD